MIEGTDQNVGRIEEAFCSYLDNGWGWRELHQEIIKSSKQNSPFSHYRYNKPYQGNNPNLIKQGVFYYHKELKIMNDLAPVNYDIDKGTMDRDDNVYWCEQLASFQVSDLMKFFYRKLDSHINKTEFPENRMTGLLKSMLKDTGIDMMLFMIEAAARNTEDGRSFDVKAFRDYIPVAMEYMEQIKNNCHYSGGGQYVRRKR